MGGLILNNGIAVNSSEFTELKSSIYGLITSFKFREKKYCYFNIRYYVNVINFYGLDNNSLKDGFYLEELVYKYLYYSAIGEYITYPHTKLYSEGYLEESILEQYELGEEEIVTIAASDFSKHDFYGEEAEWKFKIQKDSNGKIKRYAENGIAKFPKTIDEGLISKTIITTTNLANTPTGKFYFKNFGTPQQNWSLMDEQKDEYDKVTTLISFKIFWIEKEVFPLILTDFTYVDKLGKGEILETNPNVTELIKALAALKKSWGFYNDFDAIFDIVNPNLEEYNNYYKSLISFSDEIDKIRYNLLNETNDKKLEIISKLLSGQALMILPISTRKYLIKQYALQKFLLDADEEEVLKLINTFNNINNQSKTNEFLEFLIAEKFSTENKLPPYKENIYSLLYKKIDNYHDAIKAIPELFGDKSLSKDNKTRFVTAIYNLWTESKYNPYKNLINGEPDFTLIDNSTYKYDKTYKHSVIINYKSNKKFGVYNDDFKFAFDPWGNGIYTILDESYTLVAGDSNHLYQPVTLVQYPSETDTAIQLPRKDDQYHGAIPLFYLKYMDDYGDEKDFNRKFGYFIDVISIASGIGSFAELRHLRYLSNLGKALVIIDTVQIGAGTVNFLLNFVCDEKNTFCQKIKTILTFIEISSLITDPIAAAKTKKAAQEAIETTTVDGWPSDFINTTEGQAAKSKIEELANIDLANYLLKYKNQIKMDFGRLILDNADLFQNIHTTQQIDNLIDLGFNKGLSVEEIKGLIFISCRKAKLIQYEELAVQMTNWATIVKYRKFPYKFETIEDFNIFKQKLVDTLNQFGIPAYDVRIQGSCLRTQNADDIDIAIFVNESEFNQILNSSRNEVRLRAETKGASRTKMLGDINKNAIKGKISSLHFPRTNHNSGNYSMMEWFFNVENGMLTTTSKKLNVSILKNESKFNNPPYIYIK